MTSEVIVSQTDQTENPTAQIRINSHDLYFCDVVDAGHPECGPAFLEPGYQSPPSPHLGCSISMSALASSSGAGEHSDGERAWEWRRGSFLRVEERDLTQSSALYPDTLVESQADVGLACSMARVALKHTVSIHLCKASWCPRS